MIVFLSPLRLALFQGNPSPFLLGHIFLHIAFWLPGQSFLRLAGLSRAGGSFRWLTGDIFNCTHQCHICLFKNDVTLSIYIVCDSLITLFISTTVLCPVFESIVLSYMKTFHLFLLDLASFFCATSLFATIFSDSCSVIQCVYRLSAWTWFYL